MAEIHLKFISTLNIMMNYHTQLMINRFEQNIMASILAIQWSHNKEGVTCQTWTTKEKGKVKLMPSGGLLLWNKMLKKHLLLTNPLFLKFRLDLLVSTSESLFAKYLSINPSRARFRSYLLDLFYLSQSLQNHLNHVQSQNISLIQPQTLVSLLKLQIYQTYLKNMLILLVCD